MGVMKGWKVEANGVAWRYKNGQHATEKRADGTPARLNRVEIRVPARGNKPAETFFRPIGIDLPDEAREVLAQQLINAIQAQLGHVAPVTAETAKTIADLWPLYDRGIRLTTKSGPSLRNAGIFRNHVLPILGGTPLAQLNDSDYGEKYVARRQEQGASNGTIKRELVVINAVMNRAVRKQVITANWLGKLDTRLMTNGRTVVVPIHVIQEIMTYSSRRLKRAIILAVTTGQRQQKIWEMSPGRVGIHPQLGVGRVLRQDKAKTINKNNLVVLPLSDLAYAALTDGVAQLNPSMERAFTNWSNSQGLGAAFATAAKEALVDGVLYKRFLEEEKLDGITFHDLRHTANSVLQTNVAIDTSAGKKLLGHSLGIHDIYSHCWELKLRQAVDFLGEVYRPLAVYMGYVTRAQGDTPSHTTQTAAL